MRFFAVFCKSRDEYLRTHVKTGCILIDTAFFICLLFLGEKRHSYSVFFCLTSPYLTIEKHHQPPTQLLPLYLCPESKHNR